MTDVYFIVLLAIGLLIFLFVVFLLRLNLCDSKPRLPEIKSYDFEINEITKAVHKNEDLLLKLNGTESTTQEQIKSKLKICNDRVRHLDCIAILCAICFCKKKQRFLISRLRLEYQQIPFMLQLAVFAEIMVLRNVDPC